MSPGDSGYNEDTSDSDSDQEPLVLRLGRKVKLKKCRVGHRTFRNNIKNAS